MLYLSGADKFYYSWFVESVTYKNIIELDCTVNCMKELINIYDLL